MKRLQIMNCSWRSGLALGCSVFFFSTAAAAQTGARPAPAPEPALAPVPPAEDRNVSVWIGGDFGPSSYAIFGGGTYALSGDLGADGPLLRVSGSIGQYEEGVLSGSGSDVTFHNVNVLVGYQQNFGTSRAAFFVGPDWTHNGEGASADVRGSAWGVRFVGNAIAPVSPDFHLSAWGTYTTIENQYYLQGRGLQRISERFRIGPEVALVGGDTWRQNRIGGHASITLPFGDLGVSVGHTWGSAANLNDGIYANALLSFSF